MGVKEGAAQLARQASDLAAMFAIQNAGSLALAGAAGAAGAGAGVQFGDTHVTVMLGNRVIDEAIEGVIVDRPQMVAAANAEGTRQRNHINAARASRPVRRSSRSRAEVLERFATMPMWRGSGALRAPPWRA